ncbi:hypothetical protein TREMEDRAFT_58731 [Tremella mesenterica DSM 1558]|uniref:uncharacterized protein n=1 Tax=Tremella mesenterica (strain ATCC 24925 / CBS 8224 / DSM 1558 / NBRC 9311 / NRRL Y-6157 / RJB 2259-6 / UBC 559-6) TaxID=578456 RepID=UPI0003F4A4B5|nr:uncharacterized protein TREMEDRAFT_58731 [Tremella mesenterica DSM 1558]EIW72560.1 hypothetical protein TREMEDRAFT_58731 [Tremella mesenterica DSM 1558]
MSQNTSGDFPEDNPDLTVANMLEEGTYDLTQVELFGDIDLNTIDTTNALESYQGLIPQSMGLQSHLQSPSQLPQYGYASPTMEEPSRHSAMPTLNLPSDGSYGSGTSWQAGGTRSPKVWTRETSTGQVIVTKGLLEFQHNLDEIAAKNAVDQTLAVMQGKIRAPRQPRSRQSGTSLSQTHKSGTRLTQQSHQSNVDSYDFNAPWDDNTALAATNPQLPVIHFTHFDGDSAVLQQETFEQPQS